MVGVFLRPSKLLIMVTPPKLVMQLLLCSRHFFSRHSQPAILVTIISNTLVDALGQCDQDQEMSWESLFVER
jgi:hypothetical protein